MGESFTSRFVTAPDGLVLHLRDYGDRLSSRRPVVCLPGLTRNSVDFNPLACALAEAGHRVLALDLRGRGLSGHDRNPGNYTITVELDDVLAVLAALEIGPAVFIGTSRGGLITMALAAARPTALAGAVLNDIGPVVEIKGLLRLKGYVGRLPEPRDFEDGAEILRRMFSNQFPALQAPDWLAFAHRTWQQQDGRLVLTYDPALSLSIAAVDPADPLPTMWPQFEALAAVPVMVIRGANSDILSPGTVAEMKARRPDLDLVEVADQGHAPLLAEPGVIGRIAGFVERCG